MERDVVRETISNFYRNEPLNAGRWLGKFLRLVDPKRHDAFILYYQYVRLLDDQADGKASTRQTAKNLREEMKRLEIVRTGSGYVPVVLGGLDEAEAIGFRQRGLILSGALERTPRANHDAILSNLALGMCGLYLDNVARAHQRPLEFKRSERDVWTLLPYFNGLSYLLFNKPFCRQEHRAEIDKFIEWAVLCDSLYDASEDLRAGLVLFRRKKLREFAVNLIPGQPVPTQMNDLLEEGRRLALGQADERCRAVFKTEWSRPFQVLLYGYLKCEVAKMSRRKIRIDDGLVFGQDPATRTEY